MEPVGGEKRVLQIMALLIVPIVIIVGFKVIPIILQAIDGVLGAAPGALMSFLLPFLGLVMFIGFIFFLIWWVRNAGKGLLH